MPDILATHGSLHSWVAVVAASSGRRSFIRRRSPPAGPESTPDGPGVLPDVSPRRGGLSDHPGPTGRDRIEQFLEDGDAVPTDTSV